MKKSSGNFGRLLGMAIGLSWIFAVNGQAAEPQFQSFHRYAKSLETGIAFPPADLAWFNQIFDLMASSDFSFIYRRDTDHWAGLYRQRLEMVLHIHNSDANFDFRGRIDRMTGAISILRGVEYQGKSLAESTRLTAGKAVSWIDNLLATEDVFGAKLMAIAATPPPSKLRPATPAEMPDRGASALPAQPRAELPDPKPTAQPAEPRPSAAPREMTDGEPHISSAPMAGGNTAVDPITRLLEGNRRFMSGKTLHPHQAVARRTEVAAAQHPFTVVVTCSDSRVPPEILFDQGLGDLFVVRAAGEVVGDLELGSIEYALEHLDVKHILVLGHERCGAVEATIKGDEMPDNIRRIAMQIQPAVEAVRGQPGDFLDNAIRQNVLNVVATIKASPIVGELTREKLLGVNGAYYDLDSGRVSILE